MIIITNIFFYHECVQDNGLNVIALEWKGWIKFKQKLESQ
jgi:hypothetical protein